VVPLPRESPNFSWVENRWEISEMRCQHCQETLEPWRKEDPAARCPACHLLLAEAPIPFQEVHTASEQASDLLAVDRLVASLEQKSPEIFLFSEATTRKVTADKRAMASRCENDLSGKIALVQNLLVQPLPKAPFEYAPSSWLLWLLCGCGLTMFCTGGVALWADALQIQAEQLPTLGAWGATLAVGGIALLLLGLLLGLEEKQRQLAEAKSLLTDYRERWNLVRNMAFYEHPTTHAASSTNQAA
jgi:hypothetical protein